MSVRPQPRPSLLDRLERRFGRFALPNLMQHVVVLCFAGYIVQLGGKGDLFFLDRDRVLEGEVWRLATHLFLLPVQNPIFAFFALAMMLLFGRALEAEWGTFRFNVYWLVGALLTTIAGLVYAKPEETGGLWLHQALILPFATLYPEFPFSMYGLFTIRAKWLGLLDAAVMALGFAGGTIGTRCLILAAIANYFLFFWRHFLDVVLFSSRREAFRRKVAAGRADFFHRCAVCGRTEKDDPNLQFRVCPDCQGENDYCLEHLEAHEHKQA